MQNKRYTERHSCFLRGEIVLENGHRRLECEVHDISDKGMRLVAGELAGVPESFILNVPRRGIATRVHVVRRGESDLGVTFRT
jgi:hypothetical protein